MALLLLAGLAALSGPAHAHGGLANYTGTFPGIYDENGQLFAPAVAGVLVC